MSITPTEYFTQVRDAFIEFASNPKAAAPNKPYDTNGQAIYNRARLSAAETLVLAVPAPTPNIYDAYTAYMKYYGIVQIETGHLGGLLTQKGKAALDTDGNKILDDGNMVSRRFADYDNYKVPTTQVPEYKEAQAFAMAVDKVAYRLELHKRPTVQEETLDYKATNAALVRTHGKEALRLGGFQHDYDSAFGQRLTAARGETVGLPELSKTFVAPKQTESKKAPEPRQEPAKGTTPPAATNANPAFNFGFPQNGPQNPPFSILTPPKAVAPVLPQTPVNAKPADNKQADTDLTPGKTYALKAGESLSGVALAQSDFLIETVRSALGGQHSDKYIAKVAAYALAKENKITNMNKVQEGQTITIPSEEAVEASVQKWKQLVAKQLEAKKQAETKTAVPKEKDAVAPVGENKAAVADVKDAKAADKKATDAVDGKDKVEVKTEQADTKDAATKGKEQPADKKVETQPAAPVLSKEEAAAIEARTLDGFDGKVTVQELVEGKRSLKKGANLLGNVLTGGNVRVNGDLLKKESVDIDKKAKAAVDHVLNVVKTELGTDAKGRVADDDTVKHAAELLIAANNEGLIGRKDILGFDKKIVLPSDDQIAAGVKELKETLANPDSKGGNFLKHRGEEITVGEANAPITQNLRDKVKGITK